MSRGAGLPTRSDTNRADGKCGGSVIEYWTAEREVGVRNLPSPCCVLEQDTLLPKSSGNTHRVATVREKSLENEIFSRSGKR